MEKTQTIKVQKMLDVNHIAEEKDKTVLAFTTTWQIRQTYNFILEKSYCIFDQNEF